jgi:hypothetical protein
MNTQRKEDASRLRQEIRQAQAAVEGHVNRLLSMRGVLKGSIYEWKRKCGAENCRCVRGELHRSWVYSCREGGKLRKAVLTEKEMHNWRGAVNAWKAFRRERGKVVEGQRRIRNLLRELEEDLRVEVPRRESRESE